MQMFYLNDNNNNYNSIIKIILQIDVRQARFIKSSFKKMLRVKEEQLFCIYNSIYNNIEFNLKNGKVSPVYTWVSGHTVKLLRMLNKCGFLTNLPTKSTKIFKCTLLFM